MGKLANSLSPEYSEFQSKYYSDSLPKRFESNNYSSREFKQLAKDTCLDNGKYDRVSIEPNFNIILQKGSSKKVENLTPLLIAQSKDIFFSEIICS